MRSSTPKPDLPNVIFQPLHKNLSITVTELTILYVTNIPTLLTDDPSTFANAPVGLQLSGRTLEDEAVIAMTELVDAALKVYKDKHHHQRSPGVSPKL